MEHETSKKRRLRGKVFISYRRDGGADLARLVRDSLRQRGYHVFMDVEDLRSGPFNTALFREIESATDVVVILTPGSLDRCRNESDWVRLEIAHAIKQKKNIIPFMARGFEWPPSSSQLPDDLAVLPTFHGIAPSHEYFDASLDKLTTLLAGLPRHSRTCSYVIAAVLILAAAVGLAVALAPQLRLNAATANTTNGNKTPTLEGVTHGNVKGGAVTGTAVAIRHKKGDATIPPDLQQRFGDACRALAEDLARDVPQPAIPIAVGNFLYEDTELMSPFSSRLREELERALADTGKFKIVTRDRLGDLQTELLFQDASRFKPGSKSAAGMPAQPAPKIAVSAIQGIVRGRFYYTPLAVTIYAELASLADGTVRKAKIVLSAQTIAAHVLPAALSAQSSNALPTERLDALLQPQALAQSQSNLADVQRRIAKIAHDFKLQLIIKEAKGDFAGGEKISYRLWSATECHVAVFCHQVDGSTVVLFPNAYNRDTWLTADTRVDIPGMDKRGFEIIIGPPFGADVVQVIACTKASALHRMVSDLAAKTAPAATAYRSINRGMFVQGLTDSFAEPQEDQAGPAQWSEAHIVVCTYPKMK